MKIGETKSGTPAGRLAAVYTRTAEATQPAASRPVGDTSTVLGIPAHELSPKVREAIMQLMAEVDQLRRELQQSRERIAYLERLADQDALAPVANRRAFVRELSRIMAFSERYNAPASVIYFDVNGLKPINDNFGHAAGDAALMRVADVLVENVRESDVVGRLGGDEFGVILSQADEPTANDKAHVLVEQIEAAPMEWQGERIPLHVSYGVYTFRGGDSAGDALAAADRAMYAHKQSSKRASSRA
jgi:diguanylate cyclase (GGDEF)-like protein